MTVARSVGVYSRALAWAGIALLIAVLGADHRWLGQIPEIIVLFGAAVALRGLSVPLSKYSYLTQTALVGLAGSLLVGVPATALAIAGATIVTDSVWQRKPLRVAWINLGREVITLVAAYGVYAASLSWLDMPNGAPVLSIELLPALAGYALAYFMFGRVLFYFTLHRRAVQRTGENSPSVWSRIAAVISLALWLGVGVAGRAIGLIDGGFDLGAWQRFHQVRPGGPLRTVLHAG